MEVCYVVTFKPQEVRVYSVELVVVTEREKFIVPVGALGHRAVLDFPDQVGASTSTYSIKTADVLPPYAMPRPITQFLVIYRIHI